MHISIFHGRKSKSAFIVLMPPPRPSVGAPPELCHAVGLLGQ